MTALGAASETAVEPPVSVSFISSHALAGGSERYLELLFDQLGSEWIAGVVSLEEGYLVDRLRSDGYEVEVVPTPARGLGLVRAAVQLRRTLRRQAPDVVHANGIKAALLAALALPGTGIPLVWLKHDFSWDGVLAHAIAARSRLVVAVTEAITTTFGPRQMRRVRVVPNGIPEYERDRAGGRAVVAEILGDGDSPVALLVGRLHPAKGQIELIEAAPEILERRPDARFLMLGGEDPNQPDYARRVRERVAELGLEDRVIFAGHRDDPLRVMSGCDLVVMPSVPDERGAGKDACPFALLEAMSVETPVVAYAAGGIPGVLGDSGRIVAEGDRHALGVAIGELLADDDERARLARSAFDRVRTRHALSGMADAMREIYREVAQRSPSRTVRRSS